MPNERVTAEQLKPKRNKWHVADKADRTHGGIVYASKLEMETAQFLEVQLAAGELITVERQVSVPLLVNEVKICTLIIDFRVVDRCGNEEWIEAKGKDLATWRIKEKLFRALYPNRRLIVIRANPLSRKRKGSSSIS